MTGNKWKKIMVLAGVCFFLICSTGCRREEDLALQEFSLEGQGNDLGTTETSQTEDSAGENQETENTVSKVFVTEPPVKIYVDVAGAVNCPGVYALEAGDRIFRAIEAAGGFSEQASPTSVNQAEPLIDGEQIYVPTMEEAEAASIPPGISENGPQAIQPDSQNQQAQPDKVNINTADETTLQTLTGIGASKAKAIIAYREANGPFQCVEDIKNVEGIKDGTFQKIKDDIAVG